MKTTIAVFSLALLQASFFALTYIQKPTDEFAAYYIAWVLIPATTAAIVFAPRLHFVAAISNAIVATLLFDYLFLRHGYFWPDRPKESPQLAVGYVVIGAVLAFVAAGFVHATIKRIQQSATNAKLPRTIIAVRKGFAFSIICAAFAFPICTMFGPTGTGVAPNRTYAFAAIVALCLIIFGIMTSLVVGLTYDPKTRDNKMLHRSRGSRGF